MRPIITKKHAFSFIISVLTVFTVFFRPPNCKADDFFSNLTNGQVFPRIIDGKNVPASNFPAVAPVYLGQDSLCTGTLIAPQFVLTAGHCFFNDDGAREIGDTDVEVIFNKTVYRSEKVFINPTYSSTADACSVDRQYDSAIVKLSSKVSDVEPIPIYPAAVPVGATVTLVGYGELGHGRFGEDESLPPDGTVQFGSTVINDEDNTYLGWTFKPGESNTASGDSGGPAFYNVNGTRYIGAITCGGTGNAQFGSFSVDTRVDVLLPWINSVVGFSPKASVSSAQLQYLSATARNNFLNLFGTLALPPGFAPNGRSINLRIGTFAKRFRFDRNGNARNGTDTFSLNGSLRSGIFLGLNIAFKTQLRSRATFNALAQIGFQPATLAVSGQSQSLPITIRVDTAVAKSNATLQYQRSARRWSKIR